MAVVRELAPTEMHRAARALLELRPQHAPADALVARLDAQRAAGYRLAASFAPGEEDAAAVAGFRIVDNLAYGHFLYVDDLVTRSSHRARGHGGALVSWLLDEAARRRCDALHLDSGLGPDRADAHRLYFGAGLRISSFHFSRELRGNAAAGG